MVSQTRSLYFGPMLLLTWNGSHRLIDMLQFVDVVKQITETITKKDMEISKLQTKYGISEVSK